VKIKLLCKPSAMTKPWHWHHWVMTWQCHWRCWVTDDTAELTFQTSKVSQFFEDIINPLLVGLGQSAQHFLKVKYSKSYCCQWNNFEKFMYFCRWCYRSCIWLAGSQGQLLLLDYGCIRYIRISRNLPASLG
jgi:hypothetical protein